MLKTEMRNPNTMNIDKMSTLEMVQVLANENRVAVDAVSDASESIAKAVDAVAEALKVGGRLFYMGAGTSGRLGVLDASEVRPTFGVSDNVIVGIIAGGDKCLRNASENIEDKAENGVDDLKAYNPTEKDVVAGISAAGGAQYVLAALEYAKSIGCTTIGITCNENTKIGSTADIEIVTDTGAEPITGSTRMKAGTAQKLVLNAITTCAFVKVGRTHGNLMKYMKPSNIKLVDRAVRIVSDMTGVDEATARDALENNGWNSEQAADWINKNKK